MCGGGVIHSSLQAINTLMPFTKEFYMTYPKIPLVPEKRLKNDSGINIHGGRNKDMSEGEEIKGGLHVSTAVSQWGRTGGRG